MRKKLIVLGCVFVFFLTLGLWQNLERGQYFLSDFWSVQDDGSYTYLDNSIRFEQSGDDTLFTINFGGSQWHATLTDKPEGGQLLKSDQGWSVETKKDMYFSYVVGGTTFYGGSDDEVIIDDLDAMQLTFGKNTTEERFPFYDTEGNEIGETIHLLADGQTIHYREVFYDYPERGGQEPEVLLLENGAHVPHGYDYIYVNEAGEYLLNDSPLFFVHGYDIQVNKNVFANELVSLASSKPEHRGEAWIVVLYILLYALGAATILWPEKLAFLGHRWRFASEPELSDAGLAMELLGGVIIIIMSIVMLFAPVFYR